MPVVPFILKHWKLLLGGAVLLAFGIYVAVLKGTINGLEHKLEAERQAVAMCKVAVEEQNRAVQKAAADGQGRIDASAAAIDATRPAIDALRASAAALRASAASRRAVECPASQAATMVWEDL